MMVRTRFAPSPTGNLHIGGVRTALFSWLYAKHCNGKFLLRIEDTDKERSTTSATTTILKAMEWLGLTSDEAIIYQSSRYDIYKEIIEKMLADKLAYYCSCTTERLQNLRDTQKNSGLKPRYDGHCRDKLLTKDESLVVRFKNPPTGVVEFVDQVYGKIVVANSELDDFIILRSDNNPTYNFTVVVDDAQMKISHVIRGDDHLSNTPRQINLYQALGYNIPIFAHLPMILGSDGARLSKRHGAVNVLQFREDGYLSQALLNYLIRLGWSCKDQEIFTMAEMIAKFDLTAVSRGSANFDYEKLNWLNEHYQKTLPPAIIKSALQEQFVAQGIDITNGPELEDLINVQASRCQTLAEMVAISEYFYSDKISYNEKAVKNHLRGVIFEPFKKFIANLEQCELWQPEKIQEVIDSTCNEFALKMPKLAQPVRVAITGNSQSPAIDKTLFLLGKTRAITRLKNALEIIRERIAP